MRRVGKVNRAHSESVLPMKIAQLSRVVYLGVVVLALSVATTHADLLYDNSLNQTVNLFNPGTLEVGDEIVMASGGSITNFTFQYYANGLSGSATVELRFYANNGPLVDGAPTPGTLLFDSGPFNGLVNTNGQTLSYNLMSSPVLVPQDFTWSVQFSNFGTGNTGVPIFTPPTLGSDFSDYWENDGTPGSPDWVLKTNAATPMDFAARVQGVPEPGIGALAGLGGVALLGYLRRKR